MRNMTPRQRAALRKGIYLVAPALSAVLVVFGVWTNEQATTVTGAVTTISRLRSRSSTLTRPCMKPPPAMHLRSLPSLLKVVSK